MAPSCDFPPVSKFQERDFHLPPSLPTCAAIYSRTPCPPYCGAMMGIRCAISPQHAQFTITRWMFPFLVLCRWCLASCDLSPACPPFAQRVSGSKNPPAGTSSAQRCVPIPIGGANNQLQASSGSQRSSNLPKLARLG